MSKHGCAHSCSGEENHQCHFHNTNPSVHQTLDELDFDRGLWGLALTGDNVEIEKKLLKGSSFDVNSRDKYGYTALHYACRNGHLPVCKTLLKHHADVNIATQGSRATPLHRAAFMGHSEIIQLLLDHKADPSVKDCDGMIPLHKSAENGHIETFEMLLRSSSISVETKDNKGRTCLDIAKSDVIKAKLNCIIEKSKSVVE